MSKEILKTDDVTDKLAIAVTSVKLPETIDAVVRSLPNRTAWLRRVITEAAERELMHDAGDKTE